MERITERRPVKRKHPRDLCKVEDGKRMAKTQPGSPKCVVLIQKLHFSSAELKRQLRAMEEHNKCFSSQPTLKSSPHATSHSPSSDSGVDMPREWSQPIVISDECSAGEVSETKMLPTSLESAGSHRMEVRSTLQNRRIPSGFRFRRLKNNTNVQKKLPPTHPVFLVAPSPPAEVTGEVEPSHLNDQHLPGPSITQGTKCTNTEQNKESEKEHPGVSQHCHDSLAPLIEKRDKSSQNNETSSPSVVAGRHEGPRNKSAQAVEDSTKTNDVLIIEDTELHENSGTSNTPSGSKIPVHPYSTSLASEMAKSDFSATLNALIRQSFADTQARKRLEDQIEKLEAINRELVNEAKRMKRMIRDLSYAKKAKPEKESVGIQVNVDVVPARPETCERATSPPPFASSAPNRITDVSSQNYSTVLPTSDSSFVQRVRALPTLPLPVALTPVVSSAAPTQYLQVQGPSNSLTAVTSSATPNQYLQYYGPSSSLTAVTSSATPNQYLQVQGPSSSLTAAASSATPSQYLQVQGPLSSQTAVASSVAPNPYLQYLTAVASNTTPDQYLQYHVPSNGAVPPSAFVQVHGTPNLTVMPRSSIMTSHPVVAVSAASAPQSRSSLSNSNLSASTPLSPQDISRALTQIQASQPSVRPQNKGVPDVRESRKHYARVQQQMLLRRLSQESAKLRQETTLSGMNQQPRAQAQISNANNQYPAVQTQQQSRQEETSFMQHLVALNRRANSLGPSLSQSQHSDPALTTQGVQSGYAVTGTHYNLTRGNNRAPNEQLYNPQLRHAVMQAQPAAQQSIPVMQGHSTVARDAGSVQMLPQSYNAATRSPLQAAIQETNYGARFSQHNATRQQHPQIQNYAVQNRSTVVPAQLTAAPTLQSQGVTSQDAGQTNLSLNRTATALWLELFGSQNTMQESSSSSAPSALASSLVQNCTTQSQVYPAISAVFGSATLSALYQIQGSVQQSTVSQANSANQESDNTKNVRGPMSSIRQKDVLNGLNRKTDTVQGRESHAAYPSTLQNALPAAVSSAHTINNTSNAQQKTSKRTYEWIDLTSSPEPVPASTSFSYGALEPIVSLTTQNRGVPAACVDSGVTTASRAIFNPTPSSYQNTEQITNAHAQGDGDQETDNQTDARSVAPTVCAALQKPRVAQTVGEIRRNSAPGTLVSTGENVDQRHVKPEHQSKSCDLVQSSKPKPSRNLQDVVSKIHAIALARQKDAISHSPIETCIAGPPVRKVPRVHDKFTSSPWVEALLEGTLTQKRTAEDSVMSGQVGKSQHQDSLSTITNDASEVQSEHTSKVVEDKQGDCVTADPEVETTQNQDLLSTTTNNAADVQSEHTSSGVEEKQDDCVMTDPEVEAAQNQDSLSTITNDADEVQSEYTSSEIEGEQGGCVITDPEVEAAQNQDSVSTITNDAAEVQSEHTSSEIEGKGGCVMTDPEIELAQNQDSVCTITNAADLQSEHTSSEEEDKRDSCVMTEPEVEAAQNQDSLSTITNDADEVQSEHTSSEVKDKRDDCVMTDSEVEATQNQDSVCTITNAADVQSEHTSSEVKHKQDDCVMTEPEVQTTQNQDSHFTTTSDVVAVEATSDVQQCAVRVMRDQGECTALVSGHGSEALLIPGRSSSVRANKAIEKVVSDMYQSAAREHKDAAYERDDDPAERSALGVTAVTRGGAECPLDKATEHEGPLLQLKVAGNQQRASNKAVQEVVSQMFSSAAVQHQDILMGSSMDQHLHKNSPCENAASALNTVKTRLVSKAVAQVVSTMFQTAEKLHKETETECSRAVQAASEVNSEKGTAIYTQRQSTQLTQEPQQGFSMYRDITGVMHNGQQQQKAEAEVRKNMEVPVIEIFDDDSRRQRPGPNAINGDSLIDAETAPESRESSVLAHENTSDCGSQDAQAANAPGYSGYVTADKPPVVCNEYPPPSLSALALRQFPDNLGDVCLSHTEQESGFRGSVRSGESTNGQSVATLLSQPILWTTRADDVIIWDVPHEKNVTIARFDVFTREFGTKRPIILQRSGPTAWRKMGSVKAKRLPMSVPLKFSRSSTHYAIIQAIDVSGHVSPFSQAVPVSIPRGQRASHV